MDRLLSVVVFLILQGAGALTAFRCYGPVCDWMVDGYWVSPAVRVPLVVLAVLVAELLLLAVVFPCNRLAGRILAAGRSKGH